MYEFPPGKVPIRLTADGALYVASLADEQGRIVAYTHRTERPPPGEGRGPDSSQVEL